MVASIAPFSGARYQRGHGLGSVFKGLWRTAIPLLKGPVMRAGARLAGDVLRGKNMKQALKNRVAPFVGDLMQAVGARAPAARSTTTAGRSPVARRRKRKAPATKTARRTRARGSARPVDIFTR